MSLSFPGEYMRNAQGNLTQSGWWNRRKPTKATYGTKVKEKIVRSIQRNKAKRASKTMLRRGTPMGRQQFDGSGDSQSYFRLVKPKSKFHTHMMKDLIKGTLSTNAGLRVTSLEGKQTAFLTPTAGMYDAATLDTFFTAGPGPNYASAKVYLHGVHATHLITNAENVNARLRIFDVLARESNATAAYKTPLVAFTNGFADAIGGAAADYLVPHASPFGNPRFVEGYKILKMTDVILRPGATHQHSVTYKPNRLYSREENAAVATGQVGGLTMYTFIILSGTPVDDAATKLVATLSAINLNVVTSVEYETTCLEKSGAANSFTNNLALANANETMNETGNIQAEVFA